MKTNKKIVVLKVQVRPSTVIHVKDPIVNILNSPSLTVEIEKISRLNIQLQTMPEQAFKEKNRKFRNVKKEVDAS